MPSKVIYIVLIFKRHPTILTNCLIAKAIKIHIPHLFLLFELFEIPKIISKILKNLNFG